MNIDIIQNNKQFISINLSGDFSKRDIQKIPQIIFDTSLNTNNKNILLDTTHLTEKLINWIIQLECSKILVDALNGQGITLGVHGNNEIYPKIVEVMALSQGTDIKVSKDYDSLKTWLLDNKSSVPEMDKLWIN